MSKPLLQHAILEDEGSSEIPASLRDMTKKYSLSDLLPYDFQKKKNSVDGIKQYKLLLISAREALTYFLKGDLSHFDALVGENSCQIRATILGVIAQQYPLNKEDLEAVTTAIKKIRFNLNERTADENAISLASYLENNELDVKISYHELFLISSYILTRVRVILPPDQSKQIVRNEHTETKKLKEISTVGSSFARDLVKHLRQLLSTLSVRFVQEIADFLPIPESMIDMVSEKYCLNHNKFGRLKCLPCFWYTFILLQYSLQVELPFVFVVKQVDLEKNYEEGEELTLCFKAIRGKYQLVERKELSDDTPAIIVLGSAGRKSNEFTDLDTWKKELLAHNPADLILAYAAAHRQYPDESKDSILSNRQCKSLTRYKEKAAQWGCTLDNPSLFFLVHVYCDQIGNL